MKCKKFLVKVVIKLLKLRALRRLKFCLYLSIQSNISIKFAFRKINMISIYSNQYYSLFVIFSTISISFKKFNLVLFEIKINQFPRESDIKTMVAFLFFFLYIEFSRNNFSSLIQKELN